MIRAPTLATRNDQMTCCSQRSLTGRPRTGMRFGGTRASVAAVMVRASVRQLRSASHTACRVRDAALVRDGPDPADPGPAPGRLQLSELVAEPGAAGDVPAEPRREHPGQQDDPAAGQFAGPAGNRAAAIGGHARNLPEPGRIMTSRATR